MTFGDTVILQGGAMTLRDGVIFVGIVVQTTVSMVFDQIVLVVKLSQYSCETLPTCDL